MSQARKTAAFLGTMLGVAGVLHFARPAPFDSIVPPALPGPARNYTCASGAAELSIAALLAVPRTRRLGGIAAAVLFVAVFPANLQMAYDWRGVRSAKRAIALGRLPLQGVLIAQALHVARRGSGLGPTDALDPARLCPQAGAPVGVRSPRVGSGAPGAARCPSRHYYET
ncbi:MAG: DoxX family protein [Brachybacterium tyrofermentans]